MFRVGWGELRSSHDANRFAQKGDFGGGFDCRLGRLRRLRVPSGSLSWCVSENIERGGVGHPEATVTYGRLQSERIWRTKNEWGRRGIHPTSGGRLSVGRARPTEINQQLVALHTTTVFGV
jgi:hypothetical protein